MTGRARDILAASGYVCDHDGSGGWRFAGPLGRGQCGDAADGRVWLRCELGAVAADPRQLARIASRLGPARIVLRHRAPVIELQCAVEALPAALARLPHLIAAPAPAPPVVDVAVGVLAMVAPPLVPPVFLRLAVSETPLVDRARATYLLVANARLSCATGGWCDGPGLAVTAAVDSNGLARELYEVGHGLRVLAEEPVAHGYLDLCGLPDTTQPCGPDRAALTEGGGAI